MHLIVQEERKRKAEELAKPEVNPEVHTQISPQTLAGSVPTIEVEESDAQPKKKQKTAEEDEVQVVFHVPMVPDYQGRTWLSPPSHLKPDQDSKSYLPKKAIHTWYVIKEHQ